MAPERHECPDCETVFIGAPACPGCGWRPGKPSGPVRTARTACDCGAALFTSGICQRTGGYPGTTRCPLACPICRGLLGWDGGCERCHGCPTGRREDWTFPGDRYELDKGHWQRVEGPRRACTPEDNAAGFAAIRARLGRVDSLSARRAALPNVDPAIRAKLAGGLGPAGPHTGT